MKRRLSLVLPILVLPLFAASAIAQPAASKTVPAENQAGEQVRLGQSLAPLYGPWKFMVGDSPVDPATKAPVWAEPNFDDSRWEDVDLTPAGGAIDPLAGLTGYVPGWTAKGHPGYSGYAWYRIRVHVAAEPGEKLALAGPNDLDDVYQVYANGALLGSFGDFSRNPPVIFFAEPKMFSLPAGFTRGNADVVLAFRVWMLPLTLTQESDAGGLHTAPLIGDNDTVTAANQNRWLELVRAYAPQAVEAFLYLLLAAASFSLILFDRSDRVYLWMGTVFLVFAVEAAEVVVSAWSEVISGPAGTLFRDVFCVPLGVASWVMVWWAWFRLRKPAWVPGTVAALAVLLMISNALADDVWFSSIPQAVSDGFHAVSLVARLALLVLSLLVVVLGIRRQGLEGWIVLPALILSGISRFSAELVLLHIRASWFPFGITLGLPDAAIFLLVAVLAVLLLRRLLQSVREQRRMALDVKQAQELQQVILPEARLTVRGLTIESEYRPAREVGGDFFQIIPNEADGSLLIVAGDVTGKGLKAGMLVALLVGAIRSTVDWSADPMVVLRALNQRLMGRGDAQATCLVLSIASDGTVTLANAGHMAPYLNGEPVAMEGALPLGMIERPEFSLMHFQLREGDELVLLSDGIAEATDAEGHLFGFERVHELLRTADSAGEVADAAQSFGQEDDISVISITRRAVLEPAAA
jgi:hypothetical protein